MKKVVGLVPLLLVAAVVVVALGGGGQIAKLAPDTASANPCFPPDCDPNEVYICSDGVDNDGDGLYDMGDPGCEWWGDNDEWNPPPPPPPDTPDYAAYGWHGDITPDGYIRGWACDPNDFNYPISVHFYADNGRGWHGFIGSTVAGGWWNEGVAGACGGNPWHGYSFRIPNEIRNGEGYQLYSYAINICGSSCYQGNPRQSGDGAIFGFGDPAGWYDGSAPGIGSSDFSQFGTDAVCGPNVAYRYGKRLERAQGPGFWNRKLYMQVIWCSNLARTKIVGWSAIVWTDHGAWCGNTNPPTFQRVDGGTGFSYVEIQAFVDVNCASVPFNWPRLHDSLMFRVRYQADRRYVTTAHD